MSRTYKDAPQWVRANRQGVIKHSKENHDLLGTVITRYQAVLDADGQPVMHEYTYETSFFAGRAYSVNGEACRSYPFWALSNEVMSEDRYKTVIITKQRPTYEWAAVGKYTETCTHDIKPVNKHSSCQDDVHPCAPEIPYWAEGRGKDLFPKKSLRKGLVKARRRAESNSLRSFASQYNAGEDLSDYDLEEVELGLNMRNYCWYWD